MRVENLVEPLTKRELEILSLLAANRTNQEIASALSLSLNSVKWFARQIYSKLGVDNRRDAVLKASQLGLLVSGSGETQKVAAQKLPSGTVTFLFTDIQDSTSLWEKMPKEMSDAVAQHHAILRQSIESSAGQVYQIIGDAFQAAFRLASEALNAAITAQRQLQALDWGVTGALKVRMGIHTGPAELDPLGNAPYQVSHTLNRAACIMSAAHGGQMLLSQETADLVDRELSDGVSLKDQGEHHLKGLKRLEHLYQVLAPGVALEFPSLASGVDNPNNLPTQLTSFIGREKEIEIVGELLRKSRLVTLTGSGGVGKTRLSIQVAKERLGAFPDGVWFGELASVANSDLVPITIASLLGLRVDGEGSIQDTLVNFLHHKRALIILDNCEHIIQGCINLVDSLLSVCPDLIILATSREALGISGELAYRVPSMAFPDPNKIPELAQFLQFEAVQLFLERANNVLQGFEITPENTKTISHICQRLDGIPLAIELAAARLNILTTDQLAQRLDKVFRLLTGGSRTALPRQQTLRATIDWSFNLLSLQERILLCRLSVFSSGGCTLEAVEIVCSGNEIEVDEILDLLSSLVSKSMIFVDRTEEYEVRYRLLEIVRQYAHEKLFDAAESERLRDRHLDFFQDLAVQAEPHFRGNNQQHWKEKLDLEIDNLRLAMEWSLSGSIEKGLLLAASLFWFWHGTYHRKEGVEWLDKLLSAEESGREDRTSGTDQEKACRIARGKALLAAYWNKRHIGQFDVNLLQESIRIFQSLGDEYSLDLTYASYLSGGISFQDSLELFRKFGEKFYIAEVLFHLASWLLRKGDLVQARAYFEECQALCKEREDLEGQGFVFWELGLLEFLLGNNDQALELFNSSRRYLKTSNKEFYIWVLRFQAWNALVKGDIDEAIQYSEDELVGGQENGISWVVVDALGFLGWEAHVLGDDELAVNRCEDALSLAKKIGLDYFHFAHYVLGRVAIKRKQFTRASTYLQEQFIHSDVFKFTDNLKVEHPPLHLGIHVFGILAAAQAGTSPDYARRAAILFGAQASMINCLLNIIPLNERLEYEESIAVVRATLGEDAFNAGWDKGMKMSLEEAINFSVEPSLPGVV